jgi:hypothetical protein
MEQMQQLEEQLADKDRELERAATEFGNALALKDAEADRSTE